MLINSQLLLISHAVDYRGQETEARSDVPEIAVTDKYGVVRKLGEGEQGGCGEIQWLSDRSVFSTIQGLHIVFF